MAERIEVTPTPRQRNRLDVAMELSSIYFNAFGINSLEEMQDVFTRFYAIADIAGRLYTTDLADFIPEKTATLYRARK